MNKFAPPAGSASKNNRRRPAAFFPWVFFALFASALAAVAVKSGRPLAPLGKSDWPEAFLVITAGATVLVSVARQLPWQNVGLATAIVVAVSSFAISASALTGIPFGPYLFTDATGPRMFGVLPWFIPCVWVVALFSSRGVARLILRPWRKSRLYGFRLIGVTTVLAVGFDLGLELFATQVNHFWLWQPTKLALLGVPVSNPLGWLVTTLLILAFVTPVMINKSHQKFPTDYQPLLVWLLLNALFVLGAVRHEFWPAAGLVGLISLLTLVLAVRGARW
jgi:uncharacterized membrane protein